MMSINGLVNAGPGSVATGTLAGPGGVGMMAGGSVGGHMHTGGYLDKNLEFLLSLSPIEVRDEYEEVRQLACSPWS